MIQSAHLQSLMRKENLFKDYVQQAQLIYNYNGKTHTEEECVYLQKAADIQSEMAQITTGYERETHASKVAELNKQIEKIYMQIDPEKYMRMKASKEKKQNDDKKSDGSGSGSGSGSAAGKNKESELDATVRTWYKDAPKHSFEDVSGMKSLKKKLQGCLTDMKLEKLAKFLKIKPLTSYFFVGPPGCGKTYIIEAFAHELMDKDFKYLYLTGSDIISRYVGDAEKIVTRLFKEAADNAPCIVFIDEIDSVCKNRSLPALPEYAANITTSFLTGYNYINNSDKKIIFIGATNYPKRVDSAMLDRVEVIRVDLPDHEARKSAFDRHFNGVLRLEDGFTTDDMATMTEGYNYRDVDKVVETVKRIIFDEFSSNGKGEDEAINKLLNGEYQLTREKFHTAYRAFKPANKSDIIEDINDWERGLKEGMFEGTVNLRDDDDEPEPVQKTETAAPEKKPQTAASSEKKSDVKKNSSDEELSYEDIFGSEQEEEAKPAVWPTNSICELDAVLGFVTVEFAVEDKNLKKICASVDGYNYICIKNGDYFTFRFQPMSDDEKANVTVTSELGIVGDFDISVKRPISVNKDFDI